MDKKIFIFASVFIFCSFASAQISQDSINSLLIKKSFSVYNQPEPVKRKFLSLKGKTVLAKINPLTYFAGTALFVYQRVVSEQISANCCYEISCSSYAKFGIEQHGFFGGLLLGLNQFNNCFGAVTNDYPEYKVNNNYKILNSFDFKANEE